MSTLLKISTITLLSITFLYGDVGKLTKVVDGDTVHFGDTVCRLAYVDTPESKYNDKAERDISGCVGITVETEVKAGKLSSKYTASLLNIGQTYKFNIIGEDRYDRKVCIVESNGIDVNLELVAQGYAVPYYRYIKDDRLLYAYLKAKNNAKHNRLGLWGTHPQVLGCMDRDR